MTTRDKRALYIMVPGIIFVGWRVVSLLGDKPVGPLSASAAPTPDSSADAALPPVAADGPKQNDVRWSAQLATASQPWKRDPFRYPEIIAKPVIVAAASSPVVEAAPGPPPYRVTGISAVDGNRRAILTDRVVEPGSVLEEGWQVTDISGASVIVRRGKYEYELRLGRDGAISRHTLTPE